MYSASIRPKVDMMFGKLENRAMTIVEEAASSSEAIDKIIRIVSSELAARSKSMLSDMLVYLTDSLMKTDFFKDIAKQNRFTEANLRNEIWSKYQFSPCNTIDYKEASRAIQALKVGGTVLVVGGVAEVGIVLISGLSVSSLMPIPIGLLIVASIGAALADYYVLEPNRSRKAMQKALADYFIQTKQQFIAWFDEVEKYFNKRAEEIKQAI